MKNKIITLIAFSFALTIISFNLVKAVGSGGGTGGTNDGPDPNACTNFSWSCTDWSECSNSDTQTRACTLPQCTGNKPAKPAESQNCTPPCTQDDWNCGEWTTCDSENRQSRTCNLTFDCPNVRNRTPQVSRTCGIPEEEFKPATTNTSQVQNQQVCTDNEWSCTEYSKCELDGKQRRICKMTKSCPGVKSNPPEEVKVCEGLQCGHLDGFRKRVECRIKLNKESPSDFIQEQKILYSPEYCRSKLGRGNEADLEECLNTYWLLEPCWAMNDNHERHECLDRVTGMDKFEEKKATCLQQTDQTECKAELKHIGKWCVLAQVYDISQRAESLYEAGRVTLEDVVELEVFIENQKMKMDNQETISNWKRLVLETQDDWRQFKENKVK